MSSIQEMTRSFTTRLTNKLKSVEEKEKSKTNENENIPIKDKRAEEEARKARLAKGVEDIRRKTADEAKLAAQKKKEEEEKKNKKENIKPVNKSTGLSFAERLERKLKLEEEQEKATKQGAAPTIKPVEETKPITSNNGFNKIVVEEDDEFFDASDDTEDEDEGEEVDIDIEKRFKTQYALKYIKKFGQPSDKTIDLNNEDELLEHYENFSKKISKDVENVIDDFPKFGKSKKISFLKREMIIWDTEQDIKIDMALDMDEACMKLDKIMENKKATMESEKSFTRELEASISETEQEKNKRLARYAKEDELDNQKLAKERSEQLEKIKKYVFEKNKHRFDELQELMQIHRAQAIERKKERERQKALEKQQELERQKALEKQKEFEEQIKELEKQRDLEKQKEIERQKELERQRELEKQKALEKQREIENKIKELEKQKALAEQKALGKETTVTKEKAPEKEKTSEKEKTPEKETTPDKRTQAKNKTVASIEKRMDIISDRIIKKYDGKKTGDEIDEIIFSKLNELNARDNEIKMQIIGGTHEGIVRLKKIQKQQDEIRRDRRKYMRSLEDHSGETVEAKKVREEKERLADEKEDEEFKSKAFEEQMALGESILEQHQSKIEFTDDDY